MNNGRFRKGQLAWNKGKKFSQEIRNKISIGHKGQRAWNKGLPRTQEEKAKISNALKGRKHSEEFKKYLSGICKKRGVGKWMVGKKHSEETRIKMSKSQQGKRAGEKNPMWKGGAKTGRGLIIRENGGFHTKSQWKKLKEEYNFTCFSCNKSEPGITLHKDHILPISKGGIDLIENIQPLCKICNSKKGTKIFFASDKTGIKELDKRKKTILFIATYRAHLARQQLLIVELKKYFNVIVKYFESSRVDILDKYNQMAQLTYLLLNKFNFSAILIRGDRYEVLPQAISAIYHGTKIVHLEGGDLSGVIDNKIRHAVTQLSNYHFCTNDESHQRLVSMGVSPKNVWNFGSLDVEFASKVYPKKIREKPYIVVAYHPVENEDENELTDALLEFPQFEIIKIVSNCDYGRRYGDEQFSPEDYINLLRYSACLVGNSSSFLKEASIFGVGVVNVGTRQNKRLKPKNVLDVQCEKEKIIQGIKFQLSNKYEHDTIYFQPNTSKKIAQKLEELL